MSHDAICVSLKRMISWAVVIGGPCLFAVACKPETRFNAQGKIGVTKNATEQELETTSATAEGNFQVRLEVLQGVVDGLKESPELIAGIATLDTADILNFEQLDNLPDTIEIAGKTINNIDRWKPVIREYWSAIIEEFPTYGEYLAVNQAESVASFDTKNLDAKLEGLQALFELDPGAYESDTALDVEYESSDPLGAPDAGALNLRRHVPHWQHVLARRLHKTGQWFKQTAKCWGPAFMGVLDGASAVVGGQGIARSLEEGTYEAAKAGMKKMATGSTITTGKNVDKAVTSAHPEIAGVQVSEGAAIANGVATAIPGVGGVLASAEDFASAGKCFHDRGHVGGSG